MSYKYTNLINEFRELAVKYFSEDRLPDGTKILEYFDSFIDALENDDHRLVAWVYIAANYGYISSYYNINELPEFVINSVSILDALPITDLFGRVNYILSTNDYIAREIEIVIVQQGLKLAELLQDYYTIGLGETALKRLRGARQEEVY